MYVTIKDTKHPIDSSYKLGTKFTGKIVAAEGRVEFHYDGEKVLDEPLEASGCYFKLGCYTQSNLIKGKDKPSAYGEVKVYSSKVSHS